MPTQPNIPELVQNWIGGAASPAASGESIEKFAPATGELLCRVARSRESDVRGALRSAREAQPAWAALTPVRRGEILREVALGLRSQQEAIAAIVAAETGKSPKEALGETTGAIELGLFYAGEGRRFYGRTTTSAVPHRQSMTIRQPLGVAALIAAANTPIANVAWKVFPALICGNTAVLKPAEDTPATAWIFGKIATESGLPPGVLNIIHGLGEEAGAPLVESDEVDVISFTGSSEVGRHIGSVAGKKLTPVSLELGGRNPLVVCDDADLDNAVKWTVLSAFSNAGQRCASGSRIIIFESVYEEFKTRLLQATAKLKVGPTDDDDFGPVINLEQLEHMCAAISSTPAREATVLTGGKRLTDAGRAGGYYMAPTILENVSPAHRLSRQELFGPITCLYRAKDFADALRLANDSPYGLTASIHTRDTHRVMTFIANVQSGVAVANGGTYGSEPHMPFGGVKQSGNGSREPGTEALDIYSCLKDVYIHADPDAV